MVRNFKRLGLFWCEALTADYTKSLYLHSFFAHGGEYWNHLRNLGLSMGMLTTDATELRHLAFGRPAYRRAQNAGLGGRPRIVRDVNKMPVLDEDGNPLTLPPARTIDGVPGCHRSYLTCRELWLIDWGEMNP